jgi:hypothetical protein
MRGAFSRNIHKEGIKFRVAPLAGAVQENIHCAGIPYRSNIIAAIESGWPPRKAG